MHGARVSEPCGVVAMFSVVYACFKSEDTLGEVYNLAKTPLEESYDVFMHEESPNLGFDDSVLSNPPIHSHVSPMFS